MRKLSRAMLSAVLAGLFLTAAVSAQQPGGPQPNANQPPNGPRPPQGRGQMQGDMERLLPGPGDLQRFAVPLGLTEEQKAAIREVAQGKQQAIQALVQQLPPLHKQIRDLMLSDAPDAAKVKLLTAQVYSIRNKVADLGTDFWVAVRAKLTPEQNRKLTDIIRRRIEEGWRGGDRRQNGERGEPEPPRDRPAPEAPPEAPK